MVHTQSVEHSPLGHIPPDISSAQTIPPPFYKGNVRISIHEYSYSCTIKTSYRLIFVWIVTRLSLRILLNLANIWMPSQFYIGTGVIGLYPRHTGGAVPLRFLVKTATTVSVVFHSFPMCFSSRCYCGTRVESQRNHGGVTADMAIPLSYHCGLMAVPRQSLAAALRGQ